MNNECDNKEKVKMHKVFRSPEGAQKFLDKVKELKAKYPENEAADYLGLYTVDMRMIVSNAHWTIREHRAERARKLKEAGMTVHEIAVKMGVRESQVRLLLDLVE